MYSDEGCSSWECADGTDTANVSVDGGEPRFSSVGSAHSSAGAGSRPSSIPPATHIAYHSSDGDPLFQLSAEPRQMEREYNEITGQHCTSPDAVHVEEEGGYCVSGPSSCAEEVASGERRRQEHNTSAAPCTTITSFSVMPPLRQESRVGGESPNSVKSSGPDEEGGFLKLRSSLMEGSLETGIRGDSVSMGSLTDMPCDPTVSPSTASSADERERAVAGACGSSADASPVSAPVGSVFALGISASRSRSRGGDGCAFQLSGECSSPASGHASSAPSLLWKECTVTVDVAPPTSDGDGGFIRHSDSFQPCFDHSDVNVGDPVDVGGDSDALLYANEGGGGTANNFLSLCPSKECGPSALEGDPRGEEVSERGTERAPSRPEPSIPFQSDSRGECSRLNEDISFAVGVGSSDGTVCCAEDQDLHQPEGMQARSTSCRPECGVPEERTSAASESHTRNDAPASTPGWQSAGPSCCRLPRRSISCGTSRSVSSFVPLSRQAGVPRAMGIDRLFGSDGGDDDDRRCGTSRTVGTRDRSDNGGLDGRSSFLSDIPEEAMSGISHINLEGNPSRWLSCLDGEHAGQADVDAFSHLTSNTTKELADLKSVIGTRSCGVALRTAGGEVGYAPPPPLPARSTSRRMCQSLPQFYSSSVQSAPSPRKADNESLSHDIALPNAVHRNGTRRDSPLGAWRRSPVAARREATGDTSPCPWSPTRLSEGSIGTTLGNHDRSARVLLSPSAVIEGKHDRSDELKGEGASSLDEVMCRVPEGDGKGYRQDDDAVTSDMLVHTAKTRLLQRARGSCSTEDILHCYHMKRLTTALGVVRGVEEQARLDILEAYARAHHMLTVAELFARSLALAEGTAVHNQGGGKQDQVLSVRGPAVVENHCADGSGYSTLDVAADRAEGETSVAACERTADMGAMLQIFHALTEARFALYHVEPLISALVVEERNQRRFIDDQQDTLRRMARRLFTCVADALCPRHLLSQEEAARQLIEAEARQHEAHIRGSVGDAVVSHQVRLLRAIAREMALVMETERSVRAGTIVLHEGRERDTLQRLHQLALAALIRQEDAMSRRRQVQAFESRDDLSWAERHARERVALLEAGDRACLYEWHANGIMRAETGFVSDHPMSSHTAEFSLNMAVCCHTRHDQPANGNSADQGGNGASSFTGCISSPSHMVGVGSTCGPQHTWLMDGATLACDTLFEWNPTSNSASHTGIQSSEQHTKHVHSSFSPSPLVRSSCLTSSDTCHAGSNTTGGSHSGFLQPSTDHATADGGVVWVSAVSQPHETGQGEAVTLDGSPLLSASRSPTVLVAEMNKHGSTAGRLLRRALREWGVPEEADDLHGESTLEPGRLATPHRRHDRRLSGMLPDTDGGPRKHVAAPPLGAVLTKRDCGSPAGGGTTGVDGSALPFSRHTIPCSLRKNPAAAYRGLLSKYTPKVGGHSEGRQRHSPQRPYDDHIIYHSPPRSGGLAQGTSQAARSPIAGVETDAHHWARMDATPCGAHPGRELTRSTRFDDRVRAECKGDGPFGRTSAADVVACDDQAEREDLHHCPSAEADVSSVSSSTARSGLCDADSWCSQQGAAMGEGLSSLADAPLPDGCVVSRADRPRASPPWVLEVVNDTVPRDAAVRPLPHTAGRLPLEDDTYFDDGTLLLRRVSRFPSASRQRYMEPTATSSRRKHETCLCRSLFDSGASPHASAGGVPTPCVASPGAAVGCSVKRRDRYCSPLGRQPSQHGDPGAAPLMITRLPWQQGPGVWSAAPSPRMPFGLDAAGQRAASASARQDPTAVHILAAVSPRHGAPSRRREQCASDEEDTAEDRFSLFNTPLRRAESCVTYLPYSLHTSLAVPQHTRLMALSPAEHPAVPGAQTVHLPSSSSMAAITPYARYGTCPVQAPCAGHSSQTPTRRSTTYSYVDAFYRQSTASIRKRCMAASADTDEVLRPVGECAKGRADDACAGSLDIGPAGADFIEPNERTLVHSRYYDFDVRRMRLRRPARAGCFL